MTSDALAHYVIMMYAISHQESNTEEIRAAEREMSKNSNMLKKAMAMKDFNFETGVIEKLRRVVYDDAVFRKWLRSLSDKGLLAMDDYSVAIMYE